MTAESQSGASQPSALRAQNIGWDDSGHFNWAAVVPSRRSNMWGSGEAVARFRTKEDAEAYIALVTAGKDAT